MITFLITALGLNAIAALLYSFYYSKEKEADNEVKDSGLVRLKKENNILKEVEYESIEEFEQVYKEMYKEVLARKKQGSDLNVEVVSRN